MVYSKPLIAQLARWRDLCDPELAIDFTYCHIKEIAVGVIELRTLGGRLMDTTTVAPADVSALHRWMGGADVRRFRRWIRYW